MPKFAHIVGWGKYVPEHVLTNQTLEKMVDTTDEWIRTRTGIFERRIASPRESTSTMATQAARRALEVADLDASKIDLIIVATSTPDHVFPSTACLVQDALGAMHAAAFDISAACSGFVYALSVARNALLAGASQYALVIGAETLSRIVNWRDRETCVLFGDGAGAIVLTASEMPGGVLACALGADGSGSDLLIVPAGGSRYPTTAETVAQNLHYLRMNGREVFRFAVRVMDRVSRQVSELADVPIQHIELVVPHQANARILQAARESLKLTDDRIYSNLHRYGNTSAASIPIALCEAIEEGRVQPGDHLLLVGFGGGLTWGAALIEWAVRVPTVPLPKVKRFWLSLRYRWVKVASFFRRAFRWLEGIGRTSTGHTRFLWARARSGIEQAGKAGKDVAQKTGFLRGESERKDQ